MNLSVDRQIKGNPSRVSIVVSNHDGLKLGVLERCLRSVLRVHYPNYEVIMIDNDSSDGSADYIRKYFPDGSIRVISNSEKLHCRAQYWT
jgi:glycosyltransferase involved in cell wall biosynthesis